MPWFKVDDGLAFNAKFVALPLSAAGLWVRAGAWCSQQLSDGQIPGPIVAAMGGTEKETDALVACRLWRRTREGWAFHDWNEYQPTADSVKAERTAAAERMKEWRAKRKGTTKPLTSTNAGERDAGVTPNEQRTNEELRRSFGNPDPVPIPIPIPVPTQSHKERAAEASGPRRKPELPLPAAWTPTSSHYENAAPGIDVDREAAAFRAHADAHDRRLRNWNAGFTQWLTKAHPVSRQAQTPIERAAGVAEMAARVAARQQSTQLRSIGG